jgi:hypothetical protein
MEVHVLQMNMTAGKVEQVAAFLAALPEGATFVVRVSSESNQVSFLAQREEE